MTAGLTFLSVAGPDESSSPPLSARGKVCKQGRQRAPLSVSVFGCGEERTRGEVGPQPDGEQGRGGTHTIILGGRWDRSSLREPVGGRRTELWVSASCRELPEWARAGWGELGGWTYTSFSRVPGRSVGGLGMLICKFPAPSYTNQKRKIVSAAWIRKGR